MNIKQMAITLEDKDTDFKLILSISNTNDEFEYKVSNQYRTNVGGVFKTLTPSEKFHFEDVIAIQKVLQKYINNILGD